MGQMKNFRDLVKDTTQMNEQRAIMDAAIKKIDKAGYHKTALRIVYDLVLSRSIEPHEMNQLCYYVNSRYSLY